MTASLHMHPSTAQAALFTGTIFAGAVLLFWIQPLFTKMALPLLGGSPLVWNTAMVFFQAMLLAGYAYAHLLGRWLGARGQLVVHALVLGAARSPSRSRPHQHRHRPGAAAVGGAAGAVPAEFRQRVRAGRSSRTG